MKNERIKNQFVVNEIFKKYAMFFVLIAMGVVFSIASPSFLTPTNLMNILVSEASRGLLAVGVAFCIITRGIDLSLGSVIAVSSVVSASLVQDPTYISAIFPNLPHIPAWVAVIAGLAGGTLFGLINGLLIAYTHIHPFVATLGTQSMARGIALIYTHAYPVAMLRPEFTAIGQGKLFGVIPNVVVVFVFVVIIAGIILNFTRFGKNMYAIGGNVTAARASGVNVEWCLVRVYCWASFCAALAGILMAARSGSGNATLGEGYELDGIAAATIGGVSQTGGVGTIVGIVGGILVLGVINNGLLILGVSSYMQKVVKGAIIVLAVVIDVMKENKK